MGAQANETAEVMADPAPEAEAIETIMDEIETLQAEMAEVQNATDPAPSAPAVEPVAPQASAPEPDPVEEPSGIEDFHAAEEDGSMEETLAGMREETEPVARPQPGATGTDGSLTLTVSGALTLKLRYEGGGQDITIGFTEKTLSVTLADGTEFKVPVTRAASRGRRLRAA